MFYNGKWESIIEYVKKSEVNNFFLMTQNKSDFIESLEKEFEHETHKKITIFHEIGLLQNEILRLNNLKSNIDIVKGIIETEIENGKLKDKINKIIDLYYGAEINSIDDYSELIDQSNNYYSFTILVNKETEEETYHIDCKITDKLDLIIEEALICI